MQTIVNHPSTHLRHCAHVAECELHTVNHSMLLMCAPECDIVGGPECASMKPMNACSSHWSPSLLNAKTCGTDLGWPLPCPPWVLLVITGYRLQFVLSPWTPITITMALRFLIGISSASYAPVFNIYKWEWGWVSPYDQHVTSWYLRHWHSVTIGTIL